MTRRDARQLSLLLPIEGAGPPGTAPLTAAQISEMFTVWYKAFPRRVDPKHALAAFARVLRTGEATIDQLTEGSRRYGEECRRKGTEPHWIAHPRTWLNGARWLDEFEPSPLSRTASAFAGVVAAQRASGNHR